MVTSLVFKAKNESVNKQKNLENLTQRNEMIQFEKSLQNFDKSFLYTKNRRWGVYQSKASKKLVLLFLKDFSLILSISQSSYNEHDMKMVVPILAIIVIFAFCQNYKVFPFPASSTWLESLKTLTQIFTDLEKIQGALLVQKW